MNARIIRRGDLIDIFEMRNHMNNIQLFNAVKHQGAKINFIGSSPNDNGHSYRRWTFEDQVSILQFTVYHNPYGDYWELERVI